MGGVLDMVVSEVGGWLLGEVSGWHFGDWLVGVLVISTLVF